MNIFYVDSNPTIAAQSMVDRHVVKMILETAQLLSTAHRVLDGVQTEGKSKSGRKSKKWSLPNDDDNIMYSATHVNHPSAVWARQSTNNYIWLYNHLLALGAEYSHRYSRTHITISKLSAILSNPPKNLTKQEFTKMPSCMDTSYIVSEDPVENYRNYYNKGKRSLFRWTKRNPPNWALGDIILVDPIKMIHIAKGA